MDWREINYPSEGSGLHRAKWWQEKGCLVFPVKITTDSQGKEIKKPCIRGWQKAESYQNKGFSFEGRECGVLLGEESRLLLVDLDGSEGIRHFDSGLKQLGLDWETALSSAFSWSTPGRDGGQHLLYRLLKPSYWDGFKKGFPAPGVEVLGNVHYMLSPCSARLKEGKYKLLNIPETWGEPVEGLYPLLLRDGYTGPVEKINTFPRLVFDVEGGIKVGQRHSYCYQAAVKGAGGGVTSRERKERASYAIAEAIKECSGGFSIPKEEISRMADNAARYVEQESSLKSRRFGILFGRKK